MYIQQFSRSTDLCRLPQQYLLGCTAICLHMKICQTFTLDNISVTAALTSLLSIPCLIFACMLLNATLVSRINICKVYTQYWLETTSTRETCWGCSAISNFLTDFLHIMYEVQPLEFLYYQSACRGIDLSLFFTCTHTATSMLNYDVIKRG